MRGKIEKDNFVHRVGRYFKEVFGFTVDVLYYSFNIFRNLIVGCVRASFYFRPLATRLVSTDCLLRVFRHADENIFT